MGNSAASLPYSIGPQVGTPQEHEGWALHEGSRKSDGAAVSVFVGKKPMLAKTPFPDAAGGGRARPNMFQIFPAHHHYQFCKKLRHPHILQVYATLDTDYPNAGEDPTSSAGGGGPPGRGPGAPANPAQLKGAQAMATTGDLIVVTEPCIPLKQWLTLSNPTSAQLAWGLQCVVEALSFLHASAHVAHGNVSPSSFYVTKGGDVKLWNFSLITPIGVMDGGGGPDKYFREWESIVCPNAYRSPERREGRWEALATSPIHCMDSYSLGVLIGFWFGGNVPQPLQKAVSRLQTSSLKMRPRLLPLLKCPIFHTPYSNIQKQLEEFSVQPVEVKVSFWQSMLQLLQSKTLDENVAVHKVLPLMKASIVTICQNESMLSQDMYRREVLSILPPLFYIAETYLAQETDAFSKEMSPIVKLLFGVNDRGVRGALLGRASLLATHLDKNQLNVAVFEPMCSGFADSSSALRELTLKATIVLVPHLTPPNLEKLSRYLVRLQSDPETSIRTNTVIFICKLAPHLTEQNRQKMLLPAYVRAMKDPFEPCRFAALQSVVKSKEFFDAQAIATKVLPAVTPELLDSASNVRREAFAAVDVFLATLRTEDERLSREEASNPSAQPAQPQMTGSGAPKSGPPGGLSATKNVQSTTASFPAPAPSSGRYLSGLSSWMSSSTKPTGETTFASSADQAFPIPVPSPPAGHAPPPAAPPAFSSLTLSDANIGGGGGYAASGANNNDGWDDDDLLDFGESSGSNLQQQKPTAQMSTAAKANLWNEVDDDFFASFDASTSSKPKPAKMVGSAATKGKLKVTPKKATPRKTTAKPDITKLSMDDTDWDDF